MFSLSFRFSFFAVLKLRLLLALALLGIVHCNILSYDCGYTASDAHSVTVKLAADDFLQFRLVQYSWILDGTQSTCDMVAIWAAASHVFSFPPTATNAQLTLAPSPYTPGEVCHISASDGAVYDFGAGGCTLVSGSVGGSGPTPAPTAAPTAAPTPAPTPAPTGASGVTNVNVDCQLDGYVGPTSVVTVANQRSSNVFKAVLRNCKDFSECEQCTDPSVCGMCGYSRPNVGETFQVHYPAGDATIHILELGSTPSSCAFPDVVSGSVLELGASECTSEVPENAVAFSFLCAPVGFDDATETIQLTNTAGTARTFSLSRNCAHDCATLCDAAATACGSCGSGTVPAGATVDVAFPAGSAAATLIHVVHAGGEECFLEQVGAGTHYNLSPGAGCVVAGSEADLGCTTPPVCVSWGDPHVLTFDGHTGDVYGTGEFVLFASKVVTVQTRLQPWGAGSGSRVVLVHAADMQAFGDRTGKAFMFSKDGAAGDISFLVDGSDASLADGASLNIEGVGYIYRDSTSYVLELTAGPIVVVNVPSVHSFFNVVVRVPCNWPYTTAGLCGNNDGLGFNDVFTLEQHRVTSSSSLFSYGPGESWFIFNQPSTLPTSDMCNGVPHLIAPKEAQCQHLSPVYKTACIKDLCLTDLAEVIDSSEMAELLASNTTAPSAPGAPAPPSSLPAGVITTPYTPPATAAPEALCPAMLDVVPRVHWDLRPYLNSEDVSGDVQSWGGPFVGLLADLAAEAKRNGFTTVVDMPYWYSQHKVYYHGLYRPLHEWVIDAVDAVVVIAKRDIADLLLSLTQDVLAHADRHHTAKKVYIYVETSCAVPPEQTFCQEGEIVMEAALTSLYTSASAYTSFAGFVIAGYNDYRTMSPNDGSHRSYGSPRDLYVTNHVDSTSELFAFATEHKSDRLLINATTTTPAELQGVLSALVAHGAASFSTEFVFTDTAQSLQSDPARALGWTRELITTMRSHFECPALADQATTPAHTFLGHAAAPAPQLWEEGMCVAGGLSPSYITLDGAAFASLRVGEYYMLSSFGASVQVRQEARGDVFGITHVAVYAADTSNPSATPAGSTVTFAAAGSGGGAPAIAVDGNAIALADGGEPVRVDHRLLVALRGHMVVVELDVGVVVIISFGVDADCVNVVLRVKPSFSALYTSSGLCGSLDSNPYNDARSYEDARVTSDASLLPYLTQPYSHYNPTATEHSPVDFCVGDAAFSSATTTECASAPPELVDACVKDACTTHSSAKAFVVDDMKAIASFLAHLLITPLTPVITQSPATPGGSGPASYVTESETWSQGECVMYGSTHVVTFDGAAFDSYTVGERDLFVSPFLRVQTRQTGWGVGSGVTAVAVFAADLSANSHLAAGHTITVNAYHNDTLLHIDGVATRFAHGDNANIPGVVFLHREGNAYSMQLASGLVVVVSRPSVWGYLSVIVRLPAHLRRNIPHSGLCGNYNLQLADDVTTDSSYAIASPDESLFHYDAGASFSDLNPNGHSDGLAASLAQCHGDVALLTQAAQLCSSAGSQYRDGCISDFCVLRLSDVHPNSEFAAKSVTADLLASHALVAALVPPPLASSVKMPAEETFAKVVSCLPVGYTGDYSELALSNMDHARVFGVRRNCDGAACDSVCSDHYTDCGVCQNGFLEIPTFSTVVVRYPSNKPTWLAISHVGGTPCYILDPSAGSYYLADTQGECHMQKGAPTMPPAPPASDLSFSGLTWGKKLRPTALAGPGPNYWAGDSDQIWVDEAGLHLTISQDETGRWFATEVFSDQSFGYGRYVWKISGRTDTFDPNSVLGMFTWDVTDGADQFNWHAMTAELGQKGSGGSANAYYTVVPKETSGNQASYSYSQSEASTDITVMFTWTSKGVQFRSFHGHTFPVCSAESLISTHQVEGAAVPPAGNGNVRMNYWLYDGQAPTDGNPSEVVIKSFQHVPNACPLGPDCSPCSGRGMCSDGVCVCGPGFDGFACEFVGGRPPTPAPTPIETPATPSPTPAPTYPTTPAPTLYSGSVDCQVDGLDEDDVAEVWVTTPLAVAGFQLMRNCEGHALCDACAEGDDCGKCTPRGISARSGQKIRVRFPRFSKQTWFFVIVEGAVSYLTSVSPDDEYICGPSCDVQCPLGCSGHGSCQFRGCACSDGWSGTGCEFTPLVPELEQKAALVELYDHCNGDHWLRNENWKTASSFCDWEGVECRTWAHSSPSVIALDLSDNNVNCPAGLPASLGHKLRSLLVLRVNDNNFNGYPIPDSFADLGNLEYFSATRSQFGGAVSPSVWSGLRQLKYLNLAENSIAGDLAETFGEMRKLEYVSLGSNNFAGPLPDNIGRLGAMEYFAIFTNSFTALPGSVGRMKQLRYVHMGDNALAGPLPASLGSLPFVEFVNAGNNKFDGTIPAALGEAKSLKYLSLVSNPLTGTVPASLSTLPDLGYLHLGDCKLSGGLPSDLGSNNKLAFVNLSFNRFTGPLPASLASALNYLNVQGNLFQGAFPPVLADRLTGKFLNADDNQFACTDLPLHTALVTVRGALGC